MFSFATVDDSFAIRSSTAVRSLAEQMVLALARIGITHYFGVPGGAIELLFNALARQRARGVIDLTLTRGEAGAAFAADGYYREAKQMAVCTATTGPGISNLITAVMSAHADRIPMLVLTPQVARAKQGRGALQDSSPDGYDLTRMLGECTRYSSAVTHREQLVHKLPQAIAAALGDVMGPVHLSIASDLLAGPPATRPLELYQAQRRAQPMDAEAMELMAEALERSRCPLFYIGDDAGLEAERLLTLATTLGGCVVSSPGGKRWLNHAHPAFRGVLGFSGHASAARAIRSADLVLAFGATFDELSTNAWTALPALEIYSVDRHARHAQRVPHTRPVIADPGRLIDWLTSRAGQRARPSAQRPRHATPRLVPCEASAKIHPAKLMRWLGQALPEDVVVHVDAGNGFAWSTRELERTRPDTYRVAMGLCSMGWAVGAVLGAAVARRRRTICVTGDGSMLMSSLELTVAVERRLPITYIVLNDSGLGMVRHGQRLAGAESVAHDITPVRFDRLARACGARGVRVTTLRQLAQVSRRFLSSDEGGPLVIDAVIDPEAVPPMAERVAGLAQGSGK